jgi:hypothetical protein
MSTAVANRRDPQCAGQTARGGIGGAAKRCQDGWLRCIPCCSLATLSLQLSSLPLLKSAPFRATSLVLTQGLERNIVMVRQMNQQFKEACALGP